MRLKLSIGKAAALGLLFTIFKTNTSLPDDLLLSAAIGNFLLGWLLGYVALIFWPFKKTIEMSADHLRIGGKRYHLKDVKNFRTTKVKRAKRHHDREQVYFTYGNKDVRLRPVNDFKTTLHVAETLNQMKQDRLQLAAEIDETAQKVSKQRSEGPPELDRASSF